MSTLYPRLLPGEANRLFDAMHGVPHTDLTARSDVRSDRAVFAAGGGTRASKEDLAGLRSVVIAAAREWGYPELPTVAARAAFDRAVALHLHRKSGMTPGEASQPQVWAFLSLVLLPDVSAWRFPAGASEKYVADRFKGSDLTRHIFGRLWTRAHVLRQGVDGTGADPYELVGVLGEADMDQIMARRDSLAASPALVRAVVRHQADRSTGEVDNRQLYRQLLIRLLRLSAFLDFDSQDKSQITELVQQVAKQYPRSQARPSGSLSEASETPD